MWQFASGPNVSDVTGSNATFEIPVIQDGSLSGPLAETSSLSDIENSGYRLRRIVGKIFVLIGQTADSPSASPCLYGVTAGLIIRRTDPGTGGSLAANVGPEEISPNDIENSMDPWIWRRSWILGDNLTPPANNAQTQNFGNAYQGALDGPHVDQKTARIVGPEERLVLDISTTVIIAGSPECGDTLVLTDLRVLGSMRTSSGNRRNASR